MNETYKPKEPENYSERQRVGDGVHETIKDRKVPKPSEVGIALGKNAVKAYYLMHALFYAKEYDRNRGQLDFARRDRKAIQRHSFDSVFKSFYRLKDEVPSGYLLAGDETVDGLVHDVGEEFGETPLGALVVIDFIKRALGDERGKNALSLTNFNVLISDHHDKSINELTTVDHDNVYGVFARNYELLNVRVGSITHQYSRIRQALESFRNDVAKDIVFEGDTTGAEKKRLNDLVRELINAVPRGYDNIIQVDEASSFISGRYENVLMVMNDANKNGYKSLDDALILPGEQKFLLALKNTFYWDFISQIAQGDRSMQVVKVAESTDTAANMDSALLNARSIFSKEQAQIEIFGKLAAEDQSIDGQRLGHALYYLFRNLDARVNQIYTSFTGNPMQDTTWDDDKKAFEYMINELQKMEKNFHSFRPEGNGHIPILSELARILGLSELKIVGKKFF